jgi:hypothetical protein
MKIRREIYKLKGSGSSYNWNMYAIEMDGTILKLWVEGLIGEYVRTFTF